MYRHLGLLALDNAIWCLKAGTRYHMDALKSLEAAVTYLRLEAEPVEGWGVSDAEDVTEAIT